jgi:peptidyl-prolyl cis-trans isomerase D
MISLFRRALSSWLVLGFLGLIMIAFIVTGIGTPGGLDQLAGSSSAIARIGGEELSSREANQRIQARFDAERQQNPALDMAGYARTGVIDQTLEQVINSMAFAEFGSRHGMVVSKRLVDGEIASIPAFRGPAGNFDRTTFLAVLNQRKITEEMVRDDIAREKMLSAIMVPAAGAARAPLGLATPYAGLLLETRSGEIGFVPAAVFVGGAPPAEPEIAAFYQRNAARYTLPETRQIRYALFDRSRFADAAKATEAEIAAAYKANERQYAATEKRVFSQVIVPDQAKANAIAAAARAGTPLAAAARANGGEATTLAPQDQSDFAGLATPSLAKAAFAQPQGTIIAPEKSGLGWHVIRVDAINRVPGKTLADMRAQLSSEVTARKLQGAMAEFITRIEDSVADGASFDDVVKAEGLTVVTTPPITGNGTAPRDPAFTPSPELAPVLRDAFNAEAEDDATVTTIVPNERYAFVDVDRVIPATPRPLSEIRDQVRNDVMIDRATRAARSAADAIAAKAGKGMALAAAIGEAGAKLPAPRGVSVRRMDIARAQPGTVPPTLALMFSMAAGKTKVLRSQEQPGWFIVRLEKITPGSAASEPGLLAATRNELGRAIGEEYVTQLASAIRKDIGVTKNEKAIAALKRSLTGQPAR